MRRRHADELGQDVIELETEVVETLAKHAVGELRFRQRVGPRVDERADRLEAGAIGDRHLELVGRRAALDAEHAHAILAGLLELNAS